MKAEGKRKCGKMVEALGLSPAQEVLADHGEIFSCGGVYLGLNRSTPAMANRFECLFLPNYHKDVVVLNNKQVYRRTGLNQTHGTAQPREVPSPEQALRRFFKESLN
jgi:hypothetical protein